MVERTQAFYEETAAGINARLGLSIEDRRVTPYQVEQYFLANPNSTLFTFESNASTGYGYQGATMDTRGTSVLRTQDPRAAGIIEAQRTAISQMFAMPATPEEAEQRRTAAPTNTRDTGGEPILARDQNPNATDARPTVAADSGASNSNATSNDPFGIVGQTSDMRQMTRGTGTHVNSLLSGRSREVQVTASTFNTMVFQNDRYYIETTGIGQTDSSADISVVGGGPLVLATPEQINAARAERGLPPPKRKRD